MIEIKYTIPSIGNVNIHLNGYPAKLYGVMNKKGEVARLQNLLHLGVLHEIFEGMRHTRWDYTVTMLYFIQQLSNAGFEGLSAAKKVGEIKLSGRDMLQVLALASNIGHLPGTFAVEKGVMRYLMSNLGTAQELIKLVGLQGIKLDIKKVDYTNLNKLLGLVKLQSWLQSSGWADEETKVIQAAKVLIFDVLSGAPKTKHRRKILDYFNFCRRISYQLLDCLYVSLPVKVNYTETVRELGLSSSAEQWEVVSSLVDDYARIVYKQIYHNEQSRKVVVVWAEQSRRFLNRPGKSLDVLKALLETFEISKICESGGRRDDLKLLSAVALPHRFGPHFLIRAFKEEHVDKSEVEFSNLTPNAELLVLYVPGLKDPIEQESTIGDLCFDIFASAGSGTSTQLKILASTLIWVHQKFSESFGEGSLIKGIIEDVLKLLPTTSNFRVTADVAPDGFFREEGLFFVPDDRISTFIAGEKEDAVKMFRSKEDKSWASSEKQQFHECKMLRELIKAKWAKPRRGLAQYHVIIPAQIKFEGLRRRILCEFDGALVQINARGVKPQRGTLFVLEAKSGRSTGASKAVTELQGKLSKLGIKPKSVRPLGGRSAYAEINLF